MHLLDRYHGRSIEAFGDLHHLLEARYLTVNDVVAEENGKWFVTHEVSSHKNGVSEAERLLLTHVREICAVGNVLRSLEEVGFAALTESPLELECDIKVVLDRILAATGDDDH